MKHYIETVGKVDVGISVATVVIGFALVSIGMSVREIYYVVMGSLFIAVTLVHVRANQKYICAMHKRE